MSVLTLHIHKKSGEDLLPGQNEMYDTYKRIQVTPTILKPVLILRFRYLILSEHGAQ